MITISMTDHICTLHQTSLEPYGGLKAQIPSPNHKTQKRQGRSYGEKALPHTWPQIFESRLVSSLTKKINHQYNLL